MERFCFYFQFQMCCSYGNLLSYVFGPEESMNEVIFAIYCTFLYVFLKFVKFSHEYFYLSKKGCSRIDKKKNHFGHCP